MANDEDLEHAVAHVADTVVDVLVDVEDLARRERYFGVLDEAHRLPGDQIVTIFDAL